MKEFEFCRVCRRSHGEGKKHRYKASHARSLALWIDRQKARFAEPMGLLDRFIERKEVRALCSLACPFCHETVGGAGVAARRDLACHLASEAHGRRVEKELRHLGASPRALAPAFTLGAARLAQVLYRCEKAAEGGGGGGERGGGEGGEAAGASEAGAAEPACGPQLPPGYRAGDSGALTGAAGGSARLGELLAAAAVAAAARPPLRPWAAVEASLRVGGHPLGPLDRGRIERHLASAAHAERGEEDRRRARLLLEREARFPDRHRLPPDLKAYAAVLRWERAREAGGDAGPHPLAALTEGQRAVLAVPAAADWMPAFGRVWQSGSRRATLAEFRRERRAAAEPGAKRRRR